MNKQELIKKAHIVECRNGKMYVVAGDTLIGSTGFLFIGEYGEDLTFTDEFGKKLSEWDIVKVFTAGFGGGFAHTLGSTLTKTLVWERKSFKAVKHECALRSDLLKLVEMSVDNDYKVYYTLQKNPTPAMLEIGGVVYLENFLSLWDDAEYNFYTIEEV